MSAQADSKLSAVVGRFQYFATHEQEGDASIGGEALRGISRGAQLLNVEGECDFSHIVPFKIYRWLVPEEIKAEVDDIRSWISESVSGQLKEVQRDAKTSGDDKKRERKRDAAVKKAIDFFR